MRLKNARSSTTCRFIKAAESGVRQRIIKRLSEGERKVVVTEYPVKAVNSRRYVVIPFIVKSGCKHPSYKRIFVYDILPQPEDTEVFGGKS